MTTGDDQVFELRVEPGAAGRCRTILVQGELDGTACEELTATADRELGDPQLQKLVLDLRGLDFVDSAGMRTLIYIERQAKQRGLQLDVLPARDEVTALLSLAGLADRVNLVTDAAALLPREEFLERSDLELEREPVAPSKARAEVRDLLGQSVHERQVATVVLLTSELVTNAVIHPRGSDGRLGLRLTKFTSRVRVEVDDPGHGFDPEVPVEPTDHGGRGLMLVDLASSRWGVGAFPTPRGRRFTVWFEVGLDQRGSPAGA